MSIEPVPPTAAVADAALRLGIEARLSPVSLRPVLPTAPIAGPARPVTHLGSVDVLLETIDDAPLGAIMVVDNGGRLDEACVGDLMVLEAERAGLAGMVIWGLHRDTTQLREIGLPVFSLGSCPYGPRRVPPAGRRMASAVLDGVVVGEGDHVFADDDGVLVVASAHVTELVEAGVAELEVVSDSELVVKQMRGEYKVRNKALQGLFLEASRLARDIRRVTYTAVRREHNELADSLVNEALDRAARA